MNKIKDKMMKEFLENNAYFVDFFNAYFFDGQKVLKPENCEELDSEMNDSNMDLEKHVDVIRKYNDGNLYSAFIIENQSYVDMSMVVRAAAYEYVAYERMLKKSKKNKVKEKLPMVNILVFYTGEKPWNAARQLSQLVEVDERLESYFHDYKMNLIEITGNTSYNFFPGFPCRKNPDRAVSAVACGLHSILRRNRFLAASDLYHHFRRLPAL